MFTVIGTKKELDAVDTVSSLISIQRHWHFELCDCTDIMFLQIEYVLEFGWQSTIPRWEARSYIEIHEQDTDSPWTIYEMPRETLLELAKLEFNILNSLQHIELQRLSRWWKASGLSEMSFTRHRPVEYYTMASCIVMEPKHSAFRLGFAKLCEIATCLDDIYDTYGTIDELELFTAAVKRWDP